MNAYYREFNFQAENELMALMCFPMNSPIIANKYKMDFLIQRTILPIYLQLETVWESFHEIIVHSELMVGIIIVSLIEMFIVIFSIIKCWF